MPRARRARQLQAGHAPDRGRASGHCPRCPGRLLRAPGEGEQDQLPEDRQARFEVLKIQGTNITLELKTKALEGTENTNNVTFNLEDGAPDFIVIPANLNTNDEVNHKEVGRIEILGIEEYTFEGKTRELVYGSYGDLDYNWDRTTGIVIQIDQITETFTQSWLAVNTNIVQRQASDIDPMLLYGIIIAVVIIIIIVAILVLKRKK